MHCFQTAPSCLSLAVGIYITSLADGIWPVSCSSHCSQPNLCSHKQLDGNQHQPQWKSCDILPDGCRKSICFNFRIHTDVQFTAATHSNSDDTRVYNHMKNVLWTSKSCRETTAENRSSGSDSLTFWTLTPVLLSKHRKCCEFRWVQTGQDMTTVTQEIIETGANVLTIAFRPTYTHTHTH